MEVTLFIIWVDWFHGQGDWWVGRESNCRTRNIGAVAFCGEYALKFKDGINAHPY
jgi:hypothetical protein